MSAGAAQLALAACCASLLALAGTAPAGAAVSARDAVVAVKAAQAPPLDASLAFPAWGTALQATRFADAATGDEAGAGTTAMLLYDDENLYVGFVCEQSGIPVVATQHANDVGYGLDDGVTVAFDTAANGARTYAFTVTPNGTRYEYASESVRYEPRWRSAAQVSGDGYRVMMVVPLAELRLSGGERQVWRLNFTRRIASRSSLSTWAYDRASQAYCASASQAVTIYCDASRWPKVDLTIGRRRRPAPSADVFALGTAGQGRRTFEALPQAFSEQRTRSAGLDFTVPFTPTFSLVGAIAPDFSNVENDQITIAPQEFTRQYAEYRPLFAQGAAFVAPIPSLSINTPGNLLFYTPSLGIVDSGYKLEGTLGSSALGLIDVKGDGFDDQAFGYDAARPDKSLELFAQGVVANHPNVRDASFGIGASTQNPHSGLKQLFAVEQESGSLVSQTSDARSFLSETAVQHGPLLAAVLLRDIGPQFDPVDGYTYLNDVRGAQGLLSYDWTVPDGSSRLKSYSASAYAGRLVDRAGAPHEVDTGGQAGVTFKSLLSLSVSSDTSGLRTYEQAFPVYRGPAMHPFNATTVALGHGDGTPSAADVTYAFGPFALFCLPEGPQSLVCRDGGPAYVDAFVQQLDVSVSRPLNHGYGVTAEYAGTVERPYAGSADGQWLRRLSLTHSLGSEGQMALLARSISGSGGFSRPGLNAAVSYQRRLPGGNHVYMEYGSPDATATLQRIVVKFVWHAGAVPK